MKDLKGKIGNFFKKSKTSAKKFYDESGDNTFNIIYLFIAIAAVVLAFWLNIPLLQIISVTLVRVALFTLSGTFLVKFLNGTKCNVYKEIFDEHNTAAGILVGCIMLGLAIVIAVAL